MNRLTSLLLFISFYHCNSKKIYPWGGGNLNERSEDILDSLRKNLNLEVFQDTISNTLGKNEINKLFIKNSEGVSFVAQVQAATVASPLNTTKEIEQIELFDSDALSRKLEGSCGIMGANYWNYEWCHRRHFAQFHLEQQDNEFVKKPEYSMGKYSRSLILRGEQDAGNTSAHITKMIDFFVGGQRCEENRQERSTEVHIQCCEGTDILDFIATEVYFADKRLASKATAPPVPRATLNTLEEPKTCAYKAVVCTPLLCKREAMPVANREVSTGEALVGVMRLLNNTCLLRQEEWWTYELCFTKGIRQLRINNEQSVLPDGSVEQKKVVVNQYILGNPVLDVFSNQTALTHLVSTRSAAADGQQNREEVSTQEQRIIDGSGLISPLFRARGKEPKFLSLEFTNGTACDLDVVNRSVVVELFCGLSNSIVSIVEDSTCHYKFKVELAVLCSIPDFLPKKDNVTKLDISAHRFLEDDAKDTVALVLSGSAGVAEKVVSEKATAENPIVDANNALFEASVSVFQAASGVPDEIEVIELVSEDEATPSQHFLVTGTGHIVSALKPVNVEIQLPAVAAANRAPSDVAELRSEEAENSTERTDPAEETTADSSDSKEPVGEADSGTNEEEAIDGEMTVNGKVIG